MKASDLLVRALENEGVEYIFGIPGEENLDLLESLRTSSIRLILTRHEQGAGFMAATYGRLTGKTGVALATLGPGAANLVTPASYATLGGMPVLFITGQKPIRKSKQGRFQIVDVVAMMAPITKSSVQIVAANNIPYLVRDAFRIAEQEKPGAVHLELPEDIAAIEVDRKPFKITQVAPPGAGQDALLRTQELLNKAKRPLVCVASGANRSGTRDALREFVDRTGLYFFNTQMGKGVVDERHDRFLGTAALSDTDYVHCAIERADLILNVGHDLSEKPPFFMHEEDDDKVVIHLARYPALMDDVYFPTHEVIGCVATNLRALAEKVEPNKEWDRSYFSRVKEQVDAHVYHDAAPASFPSTPQTIVNAVRQVLPSDGILALDNGMYKIWFARNFKAHEPNTVLLDNALATMGAGLPAAIGAKLIRPQQKVVAICGDGGFMMNSQEMETAVRLKLDLVVIVLTDKAYGMIKWKQAGMGFEDYGLDYQNPDFIAYAASYGAKGRRVSSAAELVPELERSLSEPGVTLLEIPIDYRENEKVFYEELKKKTCLI